METKIKAITSNSLDEAKNIIVNGGVVAIPTETVYGLGGNAFDDDAVKRIFEVKGRPNDNPLIAHVHTDYDLLKIVDYIPPYAEKLRKAFLPGPLTLVYPSKGKVSPFVSCGLDTLAVRVPSHEGAQAFLRAVGIPIVAPSANLSRHVSPTSAKHVFDDFEGKIPLILDGGNCEGGIESTVCDCTGEYPVILRPGLITKEMIEKVVGRCGEHLPDLKKGEKAKSPGMMYKHYSPRCKTLLFSAENVENAILRYHAESQENQGVAVLCEEKWISVFEKAGAKCLNLGKNQAEMAMRLYGLLREAETVCKVLIVVEPTEKSGIMVGVLNRLQKACASEDIPHEKI
ncbi:MAG: threonylcarbamoyl-AMP synthase [Clostridiales bacterium]|nr:threonylcarbamoyl-AMP synthase [Clostridiales bacterium]